MTSILKTLAIATPVLLTTLSPASADPLKDLDADVRLTAGKLQTAVEAFAKGKPFMKRLSAQTIIEGIERGCGRLSSSMEGVKTCLNTLYAADNITGKQNTAQLNSLRDRWRAIKKLPAIGSTTKPKPSSKNLEVLKDYPYAKQVANYLTSKCAVGFNPTNAQKRDCNTATITVAFSIGGDAAKTFSKRDKKAGKEVARICTTKLQAANKAANINPSALPRAFAVAQDCLETIVRVGEDDLNVSFKPLALNTALCHVAKMQGNNPRACK